MKKITRATLKSFIEKNKDNLFINVQSVFDNAHKRNGMESSLEGWVEAKETPCNNDTTFEIEHVLIVRGCTGGNNFYYFDDGVYQGIGYRNCAGNGIIAVKKAA